MIGKSYGTGTNSEAQDEVQERAHLRTGIQCLLFAIFVGSEIKGPNFESLIINVRIFGPLWGRNQV